MDFAGLAASPDELRAYVDYIATVSPRSTPDAFSTADAELAYYLNSYNALAMYNVIDTGIPRSLASFLKTFAFFYWKIQRRRRENLPLPIRDDVIRTLGDAVDNYPGCLLRRTWYRDSSTLRRASSSAKREHRRSCAANRRSLGDPRFLHRRLPRDGSVDQIPDSYTVEFIDYDWMVNRQ